MGECDTCLGQVGGRDWPPLNSSLPCKTTKRHFDPPHNRLSTIWWRSWKRLGSSNYISSIIYFILILQLPISSFGLGIATDHTPRSFISADELVSSSFHGNSSHVDYFRLLQRDGDSLLIGARNIVYNISIFDLSEHADRRIVWHSRQPDSDMCFSKGKSESQCHNYIRVLAKKEEGEFLVCGTNAYKPLCRDYSLLSNGSFTYVESSGTGKCPFNPRHNSTFVFADGELYAGTVGDFQETVSLIFRNPLRTDHADYKHLNAPNFVHSFEYEDYVFFFFRETAVEYMNCGKRVYSRVARVCKNDMGGGNRRSVTLWTTFLKSRLNCSVPGDLPFYFDEIQSVSDVVYGNFGGLHNEVIYAVFTTPDNSIPGSAICAFSMRDILDVFEGPFKEQKDINSHWLAVPPHKVPEPRPGSCYNDSRTLPDATTNFVRYHPLMDEMVPSYQGRPLLVKASFKYKFTKVAIDPQVPIANGAFVDVIFIATDTGILFKTFNSHALDESMGSPVVEEINMFKTPVLINNLQVTKQSNGETKVIVITDSEVRAIPLHRCSRAKTCGDCIALQDPYCGWYPNLGVCGVFQSAPLNQIVLQNISSGLHSNCPYNEDNSIHQNSATPIFTTEVAPPPPEGETCPPCVCADSTVAPPSPDISQKPSTVAPNLDKKIPLYHDGDLLKENEVDYHQNDYLSNMIPPIPNLPPYHRGGKPLLPKSTQDGIRSGKELLPMADGDQDETETNEISIVYSEGVTGPVVGASTEGPLIYSAETLAIAVTTACVAALVVGFISGFLFSRRCRGDDYPPFSGTPHLDSKLNKCDNLVPSADPNMYTANNSMLFGGGAKHINNLVTNYNPKNVNNGKSNTNTTTENKLLKPAKCAYI